MIVQCQCGQRYKVDIAQSPGSVICETCGRLIDLRLAQTTATPPEPPVRQTPQSVRSPQPAQRPQSVLRQQPAQQPPAARMPSPPSEEKTDSGHFVSWMVWLGSAAVVIGIGIAAGMWIFRDIQPKLEEPPVQAEEITEPLPAAQLAENLNELGEPELKGHPISAIELTKDYLEDGGKRFGPHDDKVLYVWGRVSQVDTTSSALILRGTEKRTEIFDEEDDFEITARQEPRPRRDRHEHPREAKPREVWIRQTIICRGFPEDERLENAKKLEGQDVLILGTCVSILNKKANQKTREQRLVQMKDCCLIACTDKIEEQRALQNYLNLMKAGLDCEGNNQTIDAADAFQRALTQAENFLPDTRTKLLPLIQAAKNRHHRAQYHVDLELARTYVNLDDLEEAEDKLLVTAETYPESNEIRTLLKEVQKKLAEQKRLETLKQVSQLLNQPEVDLPTWTKAALLLKELPQFQETIEFGILAECQQKGCQKHIDKALAFLEQFQYPQAAQQASLALEWIPNHTQAKSIQEICGSAKTEGMLFSYQFGQKTPVLAMTFLKQGTEILATSGTQSAPFTMQTWNIAQKAPAFPTFESQIRGTLLSISPSGERLAVYDAREKKLYNGRILENTVVWNDQFQQKVPPQTASLAFSHDELCLVVGVSSPPWANRYPISEITLDKGTTHRIEEPLLGVTAIAAGPKGNYVMLGFQTGAVTTWNPNRPPTPDLPSYTPPKQYHRLPIKQLLYSPDGRQLISLDTQGNILNWNLDENGRLKVPTAIRRGTIKFACFSPSSSYLYLATAENSILRFSTTSNEVISYHINTRNLTCMTAASGTLLAAGYEDGTVKVWDLTKCENHKASY